MSNPLKTQTHELTDLEAENMEVLKLRKALQSAIDKRNHHAYVMQATGVSFGQLALSMGLTRSAVQGMLRAHDAECGQCNKLW